MATVDGQIEVHPVTDSLEPEIRFRLIIELGPLEAVHAIGGDIYCNDKRISSLVEMPRDSRKSIEARTFWNNDQMGRSSREVFDVRASLSRTALDHIEASRENDRRNDVNLHLVLGIRYLTSQANITAVEAIQDEGKLILTKPTDMRNWFSSNSSDWHLGSTDAAVFLTMVDAKQTISVQISASEWINDFAPVLGLGHFIVAELPLPQNLSIPSDISPELAERIERAIESLGSMGKELQQGEWDSVIKAARPVVEALRHPSLQTLLTERLNYPQDAADEFRKGVAALFNFSSKSIHVTDQGGDLRQRVSNSKEEAYFVFALCTGLVNLLTRQLAKSMA